MTEAISSALNFMVRPVVRMGRPFACSARTCLSQGDHPPRRQASGGLVREAAAALPDLLLRARQRFFLHPPQLRAETTIVHRVADAHRDAAEKLRIDAHLQD